ncbi:MAG: hypothetical protein ACLGJC_20585 [Alphaproteobacteria bacterium]
MKTLEQFLRDAAATGAIDLRLRVTVTDGQPVTFYVHPLGRDGDTADFAVSGDTVTPACIGFLTGPAPDASVTIERHGDRFSALSPSGAIDGIQHALGLAAHPADTPEQSLKAALDFARERLTAS